LLINVLIRLFPNLDKHDFFIAGESYAGKYVPAISYKIHRENLNDANEIINLKGLAVGDGFSDPINQIDYSDFLPNVGLIDAKEAQLFKRVADETSQLIHKGEYLNATKVITIIG